VVQESETKLERVKRMDERFAAEQSWEAQSLDLSEERFAAAQALERDTQDQHTDLQDTQEL
jgi:hypothetical protein